MTMWANESDVLTAIAQCLKTADHYVKQGNRRDAEWWLERADALAARLILQRQLDEFAAHMANGAVANALRSG